MGAVDFRVGGRIFATLASRAQGYGNLVLTPDLLMRNAQCAMPNAQCPMPNAQCKQAAFRRGDAGRFVPIDGGWGRMGMTRKR
jgi:hypothetical protein